MVTILFADDRNEQNPHFSDKVSRRGDSSMDWKVIEPTEMDAVVDLLNISFPVGKDYIKRELAEFAAASRDNGGIYRLRIDGELIATATYEQCFEGDWNGETYLRFFAVHPEHRRKGYATFIIQKIMDDAEALGSPCLCLSVLSSDSVCTGIWKRRGFELYNTSPCKDYPEFGTHDSYVYWFGAQKS
jgi:GNAT superfamily N-acetyltransferase